MTVAILVFFFNDTATTEIYTLSLHDALPIWLGRGGRRTPLPARAPCLLLAWDDRDRKSTRLNSSHLVISYAVFCLKKKNRILRCESALRRSSRSPLLTSSPYFA